jgi:glutamate racemase
MSARAQLPIGVFDSGVGGLTVVRALQERLPREQILYFGDTARVPYGVKSDATVAQFSAQITDFLLEKQVKLLIVACNTMAAVAAEAIRARSPVPVLDVIEAGAAAAAASTRNRRVGVIGTLTTVGSGAYEGAIRRLHADVAIHVQACPLFVPLVEEGWLDHPVTRLTAQEYLAPLLARDIDTLVLGCTHYPLLRPLLQEVAGNTIQLVDSADTTAERAATLLAQLNLLNPGHEPPAHRYFVTDLPQRFQAVGERFLGQTLDRLEVVSW